jgi:hypothetical protein
LLKHENTMGWLSFILQALAPIAVEHGGKVLRDSMKSRAAQSKTPAAPDPVEQLAADVEQLKGFAAQLKSDLDVLNQAVAAREEKLRKWLLALLLWNIAMTIGLVALAVFYHR